MLLGSISNTATPFCRDTGNVPAGIYLLKVNNRNTRLRCEICSEFTIKIPERYQWHRSGIFIVNFEHISHLVLFHTLFQFLLSNLHICSYKFKLIHFRNKNSGCSVKKMFLKFLQYSGDSTCVGVSFEGYAEGFRRF